MIRHQLALPLNESAGTRKARMAPPTSPTVAEFAERWLREYAGPPFHARKNVTHAAAVLRLYLLPTLGPLRLDQVEPKHLGALQRELFARGLGIKTVKGAIQSVWGSLWLGARSESLVIGFPHREIRWPKDQPQPDPYTADERDLIMGWFARRAPQYAVFAGCTFLAGMRPSEAAGLRRGDLDLETGDVSIRGAIASGEATAGKTGKSQRQIRFSADLMRVCKGHIPTWLGDHELLTKGRFGKPVDSQQWGAYWVKKCCADLGLRYRTFYHGRHTYISLALMDGANPVQLGQFCAVSLPTMFRHYARWMGSVQDPVESARKLGPARAGRAAIADSRHGVEA